MSMCAAAKEANSRVGTELSDLLARAGIKSVGV